MQENVKKDTGPFMYLMKNYLLNIPWWNILIMGIISLAFGAIVLIWPLLSLGLLVNFFGSFAILAGIFAVTGSLFLIRKDKNWWVLLLEGIFGIIIGIMVLIWPIASTIFLVYFIAAWLIVTGIAAISNGSIAKNPAVIVSGVVGLIFGLFLYFRSPLYAAETLILFIGFYAVYRGISFIVDSIIIAVEQKKARKAIGVV